MKAERGQQNSLIYFYYSYSSKREKCIFCKNCLPSKHFSNILQICGANTLCFRDFAISWPLTNNATIWPFWSPNHSYKTNICYGTILLNRMNKFLFCFLLEKDNYILSFWTIIIINRQNVYDASSHSYCRFGYDTR